VPRVLIIDDDEKLVELVRDYLAPHGFEVGAAHDGFAGLAAAARGEADVIVLDVMLPGIDGLEVCRRVRGSSDVPILMLTARGEETDRIVGLELGADDYLAKPFNPRELLARLRAVLRRAGARQPSGARLEVGPLALDPATRQGLLRGREVELTTAEFDLLHLLLASAGRVLSRDQLMEQLHGTSWSYFDRSIDVLVSRLRQKLEDDPRHPALLKTVRGGAYQLARPSSDATREGGR
jgi:two-component system, OmpR family, phosphate regulon response regulator OmpR